MLFPLDIISSQSCPTRRSSDLSPTRCPDVLRSMAGGSPLPTTSPASPQRYAPRPAPRTSQATGTSRSEEHTSELQSRGHLVCRLLLGYKKRLKYVISALPY